MPVLRRPVTPSGGSRLSELLGRRSGESAPLAERAKTGGIIDLPPDTKPLTEVLDSYRYAGRPPRSSNYLHVSDIISKCMRRIALVERMKLSPPVRGLSLSDSLTYAQGDAIHEALRTRLVFSAPHRAYGRWGCKCGSTVTAAASLRSEVPDTMKCPSCKGSVDIYHEVSIKDEEYRVTGNPDFLLYQPPQDALTVTELKSISHEMWKDLVRPIPEHVLQVGFYWHLMSRAGYKLSKEASILYATKSYVFKGSPIKEMVLDMTTIAVRLAPFIESVKQVKVARAGGELPTRTCGSPAETTAKNCDVCVQCFGVSDHASPKKISFRQSLNKPATK